MLKHHFTEKGVTSMYVDDPTLIYDVGIFTITRIDHNPFSIYGIISFPDLSVEEVGDVFHLHKLPIFIKSVAEIMVVPDDIVVTNNMVWIPDHNKCRDILRVLVCPINVAHEHEVICINNMIHNIINHTSNINNCPFEEYQGLLPIFNHVSGGLLISGINTYVSSIKYNNDRIPMIRNISVINTSILLSKNDSDSVIYGNLAFTLKEDQLINYVQTIDTIFINNETVKLINPPVHYDDLDKIHLVNNHHDTAHYTMSIILICLFSVGVYYIMVVIRNKSKIFKKQVHEDMITLAMLHNTHMPSMNESSLAYE